MKTKQIRDAIPKMATRAYIFHTLDGWAAKKSKQIGILLLLIFTTSPTAFGQVVERGDKAYGIFSATATKTTSNQLEYSYHITNADSSEQVLENFSISIKDPAYFKEVKNVPSPTNKKWYIDSVTKGYISGSAASRRVDVPPKNGLAPGESMTISFPSQGLPSTFPFYTQGFVKDLTMTEFDSLKKAGYTDDEIFAGWKEDSYQGRTIAPKVWPRDIDASAFRDTISTYLTRSCTELGWIENQGICRSLEAKLDNVERQLDRGNTNAASGSLEAFLNKVEAQKEKHLSPEAYALLYFNGQYLLEQLK